MTVVSLETGNGEGYQALVNSDGRVLSDVEEIQRVVEPVNTTPEEMSVATSAPTAQDGNSSEVVAARSGRRWMEIQNLGAYPVHIVLASDSTSADSSNRMIAPSGVFSWANGVAYAGAVQAIAIGGDCDLAVMEFYTS